MNFLALITANGSGTAAGITAVTLPGAAGAADANMFVQLTTSADIRLQVSLNGSTWSEGTANVPGAWIAVPAGCSCRLQNTNAGTRTVSVVYRYAGSPS